MDRHEVRLHQERLERRHHLDAHLLRAIDAHVWIERDHPHREPGRACGDERADPPEAYEPDRLAGELDAFPPRPLPPAVDEVRMRLRHVARLRQQECQRLLGGADDVGLGRVDHHDASAGAGLDVDVVQPDPGARDDLEVRGGSQHRLRHPGRASDDQRVVGRDLRLQRSRREIRPDVDLEVLPEELETLVAELLRDEHPHGQRASWNTCSAAATAAPRFTGWSRRSSVISSAARPRMMSSSLT